MKHGLTLSIVNLKSKHQREINYLPETMFTKSCFLEAMSIKKNIRLSLSYFSKIEIIKYWGMKPKNLLGNQWTMEHVYRNLFEKAYLNHWQKRVTCCILWSKYHQLMKRLHEKETIQHSLYFEVIIPPSLPTI